VFAKYASLDHSTSGEKKLNWRNHEIFYRPATSDQGDIYEILLR
jgi:hypothetical protein